MVDIIASIGRRNGRKMVDYSAVICRSNTHNVDIATITQAPSEPSLRICRDCLVSTGNRLARIPVLYSELEHKLTIPSRHLPLLAPAKTAGNGRFSLNDDLLEIRASIRDVLRSWSRLVADERKVTLKCGAHHGLRHLAHFLMTHLPWLAAHQAATAFVDEIHDLVATAHFQHEKVLAEALSAHTCIAPGCGMALMVAICDDEDRFTTNIRCAAGHLWNADQWLLLRRANECGDTLEAARPGGRMVSTKDAALALGVPEATIRQWTRRGKLTRHGSAQHAEYDVDELTRLAEWRSSGEVRRATG